MRMAVQQNSALVLAVPHQDGIVAKYQLISSTSDAVSDFFVIADLVEQLFVAVIGQIVVVALDQDLFTFQLRNQRNKLVVFAPKRHIPQNVGCITIGDLRIPFLEKVLVHFLGILKGTVIKIQPAFLCL